MSSPTVILKDLSIGYKINKKEKILLDNLSTSLLTGETVALIGNNGCGKSTLLRTIAGFNKPLNGEVILNGKDITGIHIREKASLISFVSTEIVRVSNMSVKDLVGLGRYLYSGLWGSLSAEDKRIVNHCISITGLKGFENRQIESLSDGERQRAMIARALAQDTPVMILDEPTAFLDIRNKHEIIHLLNGLASEKNKVVLFSTHDFNIAMSLSDKIWYIKDKSLCEGAPEDLAINKDLDHIFEGSEIKFNSLNGEFEIKIEGKHEVSINSDLTLYFWLKKALYRAGFSENKNSETKVSAYMKDNSVLYTIEIAKEIKEFLTVYDLLKYMETIK